MVKRSQLNEVINYRATNYSSIKESYERKSVTLSSKKFDVFLCHSSKDIDEIMRLKAYLKYMENKEAYVCELDDPQLDPSKANKKTAEVLMKRMENSSELYFVLSKNSQESTWMPWELGYFNGKKIWPRIYVYPIIDNYNSEVQNFKGHEYLELYDVINK